jgi:hypothetical protein
MPHITNSRWRTHGRWLAELYALYLANRLKILQIMVRLGHEDHDLAAVYGVLTVVMADPASNRAGGSGGVQGR